jgi:hypothetical protein
VLGVSHPERPARLFIGSSSEGRPVARNLQAELEATSLCEVVRWDQDVFEPSGYALDSLIAVAARVDFAVLVATPDDVVVSREMTAASVRDNVVLEFGLFVGALGRERTYLLATDHKVKLPTDVLGLTRLSYRPRTDENLRAAVNDAALQLEQRIKAHGRRAAEGRTSASVEPHSSALDRELDLLCANVVAQGWKVKTNSPTTLRLRNPRGRTLTLQKGQPEGTRANLRRFVAELRAAGVRVNSSLRRPVNTSPF